MAESIFDAQRNLRSAPQQDIEKFSNVEAMNERIRDWFETPEGTMAHNPSWGQNISAFKHDPLGNDISIQIEMAISYKLPIDIEDIQLIGIETAIEDIDLLKIYIIHQYGDVLVNFMMR